MMTTNHEFGELSSSPCESCVYDLTEDLVIEILMRLPVMDVIKMKRVCKSLYWLISSSDFIAKYSLLDGDRDPYMFIRIPGGGTRVVYVSYDEDHGDGDDTTGPRSNRPVIHIRPSPTNPRPLANSLAWECGCDGVLEVRLWYHPHLSTLWYHHHVLWNPATGDIKQIPPFPDDSDYSDDSDDSDWTNYFFPTDYGCGFDSKNNEYRPFVVRSAEYSSHGAYKMEIEIYSYKYKTWKIIKAPGIVSHGTHDMVVYANGICHWAGFSSFVVPNGRDVIVSFDITNEVILTTPFPDDILLTYSYSFPYYDRFYCPYPLLLNHSLALVVNQHGHWNRDNDRTTSCFDIWVLGEYGNQHSWTKLFTIGPLHGIQHVIGFWNETKIFLAQRDSLHGGDAHLFLYDTVTQQSLNCLQTVIRESMMCPCRLSLLPIAADGSKKTKIKKQVRIHHGSKKTKIKKQVRIRAQVLAIEITNQKKKMKTMTK